MSLLNVSFKFKCSFYTSLLNSHVSFIRLLNIHISPSIFTCLFCTSLFISTCLFSYSYVSFIRLFSYSHVSFIRLFSYPYVSFTILFSQTYCTNFYLITHDPPSFFNVSLPFIYLFFIHISLSYSYVSVLLHPYFWHSYVSLWYEFLSHHPAHRRVLNLSHMFTKRDVECWRKETYMKCA